MNKIEKLQEKFIELATIDTKQKNSGFWTGKIGKELKKEILENDMLKDFITFREKRWALFNNCYIRPKCIVCGSKTPFLGINYQETCSIKCGRNNPKTIQKIKQTNLERYGVEIASKSEIIKKKSIQTCLEKYGVENVNQNKAIQNKSKKTCLEKYGVEYSWQAEEVKEKIKQTNLERYETEYSWQAEEVKEKIKQTNLKKYGVENANQNIIIQNKSRKTCFKKYGTYFAQQAEEIKEKIKQTNLEKYGVESPLSNNNVKEKIKQTNLERYGVEYPLQNIKIFRKSKKYQSKIFIFTNGETIKVQGYEPFALELLEKQYPIEDIITKLDFNIKYFFNNKTRIYHPDIFIKKENKIIEVKSEYTYKKDLHKNIAKKEASISQGFLFEFWIFNSNRELNII